MITFEGIDFISTPECEITSHTDDTDCTNPSVVRVRTQCQGCGHCAIRFYCRKHYKGLTAGQVVCGYCKSDKLRTRVS